jgi:IPT/TIG domain
LQIPVGAGQFTGGVNFAVQARPRPVIYGMQTYGYINGAAVAEPPMTGGSLGNPLVFYASGITTNNQTAIAPGLSVSVIGSAAALRTGTLAYYTEGYLLTYVDTATVAASTPAALAVTLGNDLYVLPQAFTVEPVAPPSIKQITPGAAADGSANLNIAGTNLGAATTVTFDGAPATLQAVNADGSLTVVPPPAPSAYAAVVEAVNPEGQTSLQSIGTGTAPTYAYGVANAPSIAVQPAIATAGTDLMLTITGVNTHFADGQTVVGLGTSDMTVRRVWVVSPTLIQLNVTVGAGASSGPVSATVSTGLELVTLPTAVAVVAPTAQPASLRAPGVSTITGLAGVPIGGTVSLAANGLPTNLAGWSLTIGGVSTTFGVNSNGILTAAIPAGVSFGPNALQLTSPAGTGPSPILIQVDAPPPVIAGAIDSSGAGGTGFPISSAAPANAGDVVTLAVADLAGASSSLPSAASVWITVGAATVQVASVTPGTQGTAFVQFVLPAILANSPTATQQLVSVAIGTGTRLSSPYLLAIVPVLPAPSN